MKLIGILGVLLAIFVGIYLGFWVMFIGGIVQVVDAFKMDDIDGLQIGVGIVRVILASAVGWVSALFIGLPSIALIQSGD